MEEQINIIGKRRFPHLERFSFESYVLVFQFIAAKKETYKNHRK